MPARSQTPSGFPGLLALAVIAIFTTAVHAVQTTIGPPREAEGYIWVDVHNVELFSPRVRESLDRGMPATLIVHSELWRRRQGWFDRLEESHDAQIRIRYQISKRSYRLDRAGVATRTVSTLDSVAAIFSGPFAVRVGRVGDLKSRASYYIAIATTLKPLSVEDVAEVEDWLSGEVADKRSAGLGVITQLPRALFDAVRNFAGFGDQHARTVSREFTLGDLFP
ncbi:MAG TPA: DUF4390 domain-containing protein [Candidatus Limnocylindria bacterium]|nr:DUF4390 domain-containing protein [Candidatus Limnocylindria bacterium]